MGFHFYILLLFFTVNCSLASSQWSSDRFLFPQSDKGTRLKTIKETSNPENKILKVNQSVLENENNDKRRVNYIALEQRMPASINNPKVNLGILMGYIDFILKSNNNSFNFNNGAASLGVQLKIESFFGGNLCFSYITIPNLKIDQMNTEKSKYSVKFENFSLSYLKKIKNIEMEIGPVISQRVWWASVDKQWNSLQQTNSIGVEVKTGLSKQGKLEPSLKFKYIPIVLSGDRFFKGNGYSADGIAKLKLESNRNVIFEIGYEQVNLKDKLQSNNYLTQSDVKIFFGYFLSE